MNIWGYKHRFSEKGKRYAVTTISLLSYLISLPFVMMNLFRKKEIDHEKIEKLLIIRNDGIGDFILSLNALHTLRRSFRRAKITACIPSWQEEIAVASNLFDEIIIFDAKKSEYLSSALRFTNLFSDMLRQIPLLRRKQFDLALDIRGDLRNRIIIFLSAVPYRVSFDVGGMECLLTHQIHYREKTHEVDHFNDLAIFFTDDKIKYYVNFNVSMADEESKDGDGDVAFALEDFWS